MQHDHLPAIVRVWFADGVEGIVKPLHSTTVPLIPALAVNLKVEVMSAAPIMLTVPTLVRVAKKSKSSHWMADKLLHPSILESVGANCTRAASRTGAAPQPIRNVCVTVQVKVTTSPRQAVRLPSRVEDSVMVAGGEFSSQFTKRFRCDGHTKLMNHINMLL